MAAANEHALQNTWVLWEHTPVDRGATAEQWANSMKEVCEFSSVEQFWKHWAFIPRPSEIFSDGKSNKTVGGRLVDTFSVFKKGIHPSWEDAENKKGCEIFLRKTLSADMTDLYWENLILGILGQTIEEDDELCGCRIVDKTKKTSKDPRPVHRFEVWLRTRDDSAVDKCKQRVADTLTDGKASKNLVDQFGYSSHA